MQTFLGLPDPIAFELFGYEVRWYALLISIAFLLGLMIAMKRAKKQNLKPDDLLDLFIFLIPAAIIGARLYYVLFNLDYYTIYPDEIIKIWHGGLAIHGGVIAGIIVLILVCRHKKIPVFQMMDILIPSLILGQAIGRWGNYFNMEAYGTETTLPWAITVYDPIQGYIQVHPTFLYESLWNILVFFVLLFVIDRIKKVNGETTCWYFILYSIGRFFIEGLRTDSLYVLGLRTAQIVSILSIIIGIIALIILRKRNKEKTLINTTENEKT